MKPLWQYLTGKTIRRHQAVASTKCCQLKVEALEGRLVPTVLFQPQYGAETRLTTNDYGEAYFNGPVLSNTRVNLVFEGDYWRNPSGVTWQSIVDDVNKILSSQYLSGLTQYGSNGLATLNSWTLDSSMPSMTNIYGNMMFYDADLQSTAQQDILKSEALTTPSDRGVYFVVTPPNAYDLDNPPPVYGYHTDGDINPWGATASVPYGWISIQGSTKASQIDSFSKVFSHELVETISDPYVIGNHEHITPGVQVFHGANLTDTSGLPYDEIADFEPDGNYTYRLASGPLVQAYWSVQDGAFIVPDGSSQSFALASPTSLIVNGNQLANKNDVITIDTVTSTDGDRLRISLNGSVSTFDAHTIKSVTINTGDGSDIVNVEGMPADVRLDVRLGNGADAVNFSPVARQMNNLDARSVTIRGGGATTLTVNDGNTTNTIGPNSERHTVNYSIQDGELTRVDFVENRSQSGSILQSTTTTYQRYENDFAFSGISHLYVYGGQCANTYDIQTGGLTTPVTVWGSPNDILNFNDTANAAKLGNTYTVTNDHISRLVNGQDPSQTANVEFQNLPTVNLNASSAAANYNILAIDGGTQMNIFPGAGRNAINVGDDNNALDSITGGLNIWGNGLSTLVLNDRATFDRDGFTNTVAFQIVGSPSVGTVTRNHTLAYLDAFGPLSFSSIQTVSYSGMQNVVIQGGLSPTTLVVADPTQEITTPGDQGDTLTYGKFDVLPIVPIAQTQDVTFDALADMTYGDGTIALDATASSGLPVSYQIISGPATITDNILTITGAGVVTVEASQAGDDNYDAATPVDVSFTVNKAILTVKADNKTRVFGQAAPAFTVSFAGFVHGDTLENSGVTGAANLGSSDTAASPVGVYSINAALGTLAADNYDFAFVAGSLRVNRAETTIDLKSNASVATVGQQVIFTATVAAATPVAGIPTGTVTFKDGATVLGTATLNHGVATVQTAMLALGSHSITAVYGGSSNFNGHTSPAVSQKILQASKITLQSSLASSTFGQAVTWTATVAPAAGAATPTGTVTFRDGAAILGTVALSARKATLTLALLGAGSHAITATYNGNTALGTSTSTALTQIVKQAAIKATLISSASTSQFGKSILLTANVSAIAPGVGVPNGTATIKDGATLLGTVTLSNGKATFQTAKLAKGKHTLTLVFSGDANFAPSTSIALTLTIA